MLLFNSETTIQTGSQKFISIHLMLLFNRSRELSGIQRQHFNTSNVTIQLAANSYSIHNSFISIHLMLLFNSYINQPHILISDFNTSNVTIQPHNKRLLRLYDYISIHLMLLFNKILSANEFVLL